MWQKKKACSIKRCSLDTFKSDCFRNEKYEADTLQNAIIRTFENRHTPYDADTKFFRENFAELEIMQVRWKAFLRKITKTEGVSFAEVVQYLQEKLRPYWDCIGRQS